MTGYRYKWALLVVFAMLVSSCRLELTHQKEQDQVSASSDFADGTFRAEVVLLDSFRQPSQIFNTTEVVTLEYRLTNLTHQETKLTFRSGQRISSVVTENDELRLNIDALFVYTQAISEVVIAANQTQVFALSFNADLLGSGNYRIIAGASLSDIHPEYLISADDNLFVARMEFNIVDG